MSSNNKEAVESLGEPPSTKSFQPIDGSSYSPKCVECEFSKVASVVVSHHTGSRTQRRRTRRRRHSREVGQPDLHTGGGHPGSSRPSVAFAAPLGQSHIFAEPHNSTVACLSLDLCTEMPSRRILGTSPVGNSANFACWMFSESA